MGKDLKGKEIGKGIIQRKEDKYYQAKFSSVTGKRISKNFKFLSEARQWLEEAKFDDKHKFYPGNTETTVNEWFKSWLEYNSPRLKYSSIKYYKNRYKYRIEPVIGEMLLCDIKPFHCQKVLNEAMAKNDTSGSIAKIRSMLFMIFDSAIENEILKSNPLTKSVKYMKKPPKEKRVLTKKEQYDFINSLENNVHRDEFIFVLNTGLRVGELSALKWSDIDWHKKTIKVTGTLYYKRPENEFFEDTPKSRASNRTIPLTEEAYEILLRKKKENSRKNTYVFLNKNGNPTLATVYDKCLGRAIKKIIGGNDSFSMHSLRHTFATRCIEAGMKPKALQKILGHEKITTTMDLYVHITGDELSSEIKKLEGVI